jgi:Protein of unknown function (DUF3987)
MHDDNDASPPSADETSVHNNGSQPTVEEFRQRVEADIQEAHDRIEVYEERAAIAREPPAPVPIKLPTRWPKPMGPEAFRGVAGQIVELVDPDTEADPAAVLVQLLVALGSVVGRTAYWQVGADRHYTNLFAVIVGRSSKARKGSGWGHVRYIVESLDKQYEGHIANGIGSGEGIIWLVRDDVEKQVQIKDDKGRIIGRETIVTECGVLDKRLLIVEDEFAQILRVSGREGSTVSVIIRRGWGDGNLKNAVKNSPLKTTGAHISIIGHITLDELKDCLSNTDTLNGFGNRFLWVCSKRSKELPDGGGLPDLQEPLRRLLPLINTISGVGEIPIRRDKDAGDYWRERYHDLSKEKPGLFGALTSRAEAQVMRLALAYAVLDGAVAISRDHLISAFEVWRYVEDSVRYMFDAGTGNKLSDTLLTLLREHPDGLTRTELRNLTKRHFSQEKMQEALTLLQEYELANGGQVKGPDGRPAEVWFPGPPRTLSTKAGGSI